MIGDGRVFSPRRLRDCVLRPARSAGAIGWLPVVDAGAVGIRGGGSHPPGRFIGYNKDQAPGALGLQLVQGRDFTDADRDGALPVAIVSERFAQSIWPGENVLGKRFKVLGPAPMLTIVGVVRDIRARGFADTPEPTMYFPFAQSSKSSFFMPRNVTVLVRASVDPATLGPTVRDVVRALDKTAPVSEIRTLEQVVGTSVSKVVLRVIS
jgi:hypothetical protein